MSNKSPYESKQPGADGTIAYSETENHIWYQLTKRQEKVLPGRACEQFIHGLKLLQLPRKHIPQVKEVNKLLGDINGWGIETVSALIEQKQFYQLLANKRFPAASFIRRQEHFDYLQEPDIFHEVYGHTPLLTDESYANFHEAFGELGLQSNEQQSKYLSRIYWFTIEFGLINTDEGLRAYGGGILSSPGETVFSVEDDDVKRQPMDVLTMMRTPYRIDMFQSVYFVIDDFADVYAIINQDLFKLMAEAEKLGDLPKPYPPVEHGDFSVER